MRNRVFLATLIAAGVLLAGQSSALAATPDVNEIVCAVTGGRLPTVLPPSQVEAPIITNVYRNTSGAQETWEPATGYDGRYWSRAGGNDTVIEVAVPANGYTLNVYKNSKLIHSEKISACDPYVTVPLPLDEGDATRHFRYQTDSTTGPATTLKFAVDTTAPVIASDMLVGPGTADITFSEPILEGRDNQSDWYVRWSATVDGQVTTVHTSVDSVLYVDTVTRRVQFSGVDEAGYSGVDYQMRPDEPGERYRDAAGNPLADTITSS